MRQIINLNSLYKILFDKKFRTHRTEKFKLLNKPRYVPGTTSILPIEIEYVDAITCYSGFVEIFEKEPYKFFTSQAAPVIIDCGANIGLSVIYFKTLYPDAHVLAFEPDPNIFRTLKKNIENFKAKNVEILNSAVWISDGTLEFQLEGGMSGRIPKITDKNNLVTVNSSRLRFYLNKRIDFLKIDIEGAEYDVLKDCADLLINVEYLFIEYHSHVSEQQKLDEILSILTSAGFRYYIHEAFTVLSPFTIKYDMIGMDLQLNIYAKR